MAGAYISENNGVATIQNLQLYLGEHQSLWLSACSVFPILSPELTVYFGEQPQVEKWSAWQQNSLSLFLLHSSRPLLPCLCPLFAQRLHNTGHHHPEAARPSPHRRHWPPHHLRRPADAPARPPPSPTARPITATVSTRRPSTTSASRTWVFPHRTAPAPPRTKLQHSRPHRGPVGGMPNFLLARTAARRTPDTSLPRNKNSLDPLRGHSLR